MTEVELSINGIAGKMQKVTLDLDKLPEDEFTRNITLSMWARFTVKSGIMENIMGQLLGAQVEMTMEAKTPEHIVASKAQYDTMKRFAMGIQMGLAHLAIADQPDDSPAIHFDA